MQCLGLSPVEQKEISLCGLPESYIFYFIMNGYLVSVSQELSLWEPLVFSIKDQ